MDITINTPAILFPAISLVLLAYTNRFLGLAAVARKLHEQYNQKIENLNSDKLNLIIENILDIENIEDVEKYFKK